MIVIPKIFANIAFRFRSTDDLLTTLDWLNRTHPDNTGINISRIDKLRRGIMRELLRRPTIGFNYFVQSDTEVTYGKFPK